MCVPATLHKGFKGHYLEVLINLLLNTTREKYDRKKTIAFLTVFL
jgi:hypothetical protein